MISVYDRTPSATPPADSLAALPVQARAPAVRGQALLVTELKRAAYATHDAQLRKQNTRASSNNT